MIDSDPFFQWIDVPDDQALPPVDDDVSGLKDLLSLGIQTDLYIDHRSGLLLHQDTNKNISQGIDVFDEIASPNAAFFPPSDSPSPYINLFPPALSPDLSPTSVASSPWLRTPETDQSHTNLAPVDALWDIVGEERIYFLDQSGNNLEDIVQDVIPEDIACTPQIPSSASFITTPHAPFSNIPTFVVSSPTSQFGSCTPFHGRSLSPSLSPLTPVSFFPQSPNTSPTPYSVPLSNSDEKVEPTNFIPSTPARVTSIRLRAKRNADTLDGDAPPWKISRRRSKPKHVDEEEWSPDSERAKRPRIVSSSQSTRHTTSTPNCPPDEGCATSQGSEGHSDTTHTTCHICGQGFTRASDYVRHIQNSSNHPETRKVWPCPYCDSALGRKDALGRHIKTLHPGKSVFIPECIPGSQSESDGQKPHVQRIGQRNMPLRRQPRMVTRRYT